MDAAIAQFCHRVDLVYLLVDVVRHSVKAARDWSSQDPTAPDLVADPVEFVGLRLRKELLRATDLGGRWTVAALLWSLVYFAVTNLYAVDTAALNLSRLVDEYINIALLVGPIFGLAWWRGEGEYRQGLLAADRAIATGRFGDPGDAKRLRWFLASADVVAGILAAALVAFVVVTLRRIIM